MNTVIKTSPWGFLLSAIAAVVVAYKAFSDEAEKMDKIQQNMNDIHEEATKNISKQKNEIELLAKVARDEARSQEEREKAIARLNDIIPDHIGILSLQNIKTLEGKNILDQYTESIYKNARARAAQAKFDELAKQRLEIENKTASDYRGGFSKFMSDITGQTSSELDSMKTKEDLNKYILKYFSSQIELRKGKDGKNYVNKEKFAEIFNSLLRAGLGKKFSELGRIDEQMKALAKELLNNDNINAILNPSNEPSANPNAVPGEKGKDGKNYVNKEKYDDSYLNEEQKTLDELLKMRKQNDLEKIDLMQDGINKEIALEKTKHYQKINELIRQNEEYNKIATSLDKQITDAEKAGDTKKVESLKRRQGYVVNLIEENNNTIEHEEQMHQLRLGTLQEKAAKDNIEKLHESYEQEKLVRETNFLNELETLNLNAEEKEKLKKEFYEKESQLEIDYLNKQVDALKKAISEQEIDGIQFNLLTEEQKDELAKQIEEILNAIAKIQAAKNNLQGKDAKEIDLGLGGGTDILGFSPEQWQNFYKNIEQGKIGVQTMQFAVSSLKNVWNQFAQLQAQAEANNLKKYENNANARKKALKKQLDAGVITQEQYSKRIELIDQDIDKRKAEAEYKQAKRQKNMAIADTIINTATSIMKLWSSPGYPAAIPLSIMVGALGAVQLATIARQPLPSRGAEEGYYPNLIKREQDGKIFRTTGTSKIKTGLYSKPRLLVGEGPGDMPEMVIDKKAFAQISPETKAALFREIRMVKGFEKGYYPQEVYNKVANNNQISENDVIKLLINAISKNTEAIDELRQNPLIAYLAKDYRTMKELKESLKEYDNFKSKQQI